jgi:prolyl oligopeptidase
MSAEAAAVQSPAARCCLHTQGNESIMPLPRAGLASLVVCCLQIATIAMPSIAGEPTLPRPPVTPVRVEHTKLGALTAVDPYRWMEDPNSGEFVAWAKDQAAYTRAVLDKNTQNLDLAKRIHEIAVTQDAVANAKRRGDELFYLKRLADADTFSLMMRVRDGAERMLFDPRASSDGSKRSIDYYEPSPDGRYVAFGVSANGSEESVLQVLDARLGKLLPERIARAHNGSPAWRPDGTAFFYTRRPPVPPDAPTSIRNQRARSYLHVVGNDPARDAAVFGFEVSPAITMAISDSPSVYVAAGSSFALAIDRRGAMSDLIIYWAPSNSVFDNHAPWKKLADVEDGVEDYCLHGDDLYLLLHRDAARHKVVRVSLDTPDLSKATVVVPNGTAVNSELAVASDALYVRILDAGIGRILRVPFDGSPPTRLTLPVEGAIRQLDADPSRPGVTFELSSWTQPRAIYAYDPVKGHCADLALTPPPRDQAIALESHEVMVRSADGTEIPLSIVHRRGLDSSRPHRTLLKAYGSYGFPLAPRFDPRDRVWFERDGIFATAHVRGGGEYGEEWHVAGMKQRKQRSIDDYLACARYLIAEKMTSPSLLAAEGGSAGAIVIGSAITQKPELFGAAFVYVGIFDPLRFESGSAIGAMNAREFGSAANPDELPSLYAMSAYYQVRDHVPYPATLFTGGAHDARVPLWQPAKMAARLQAATSSNKPVLLRIDYEGGHGYSSESEYESELADEYAFLLWQLRDVRAAEVAKESPSPSEKK